MADSSHLEKMGRELKCPICLSLFNSAVSLTCNHIFCNLCIEKSMKSDSSCPVCKVPYRRREVRPAPHMDNLVNIYKSMEIASGVNMFVTQPVPSTKLPDQDNQTSVRQESDSCQEMSKDNRKSRLKKQKKTREKSSDPVKPSFPTKKRVQVPQDPSSETPVRERLEGGLGRSTEARSVETSVVQNQAEKRKGDSAFTPFFWLRDEEDVEKLSQQTDADQTMGTPPNAPCFSDLMDSDDDNPAKVGTSITARDADCFDSEMFEWTQKPCSPELWSSPVKSQVPDSEEVKETNLECKIVSQIATRTGEHKADNLEGNKNDLLSPRAEISVDRNKKSIKRGRKSSQRGKKKEASSAVSDIPMVQPGSEDVVGRSITQKKSEGNITLKRCSKKTHESNKKVRFEKRSVQPSLKSDHELESRKKQKVSTEGVSMDKKATKCIDGNNKDSAKSNSSYEVRDAQFFIEINIPPPVVNGVVLRKCDSIPKKFKCAFCRSTEDSEATGDMVHYVNGKPVTEDYGGGLKVIHAHRNCTEWAPNVYFEDDNAVNLEAEVARSKRIKCSCCDVKGAALGCYEKSCRKSFHVSCAKLMPQCRWDNDNFVMLCPLHASSKLPNEIPGSQKKKQKTALKRSIQSQHSDAVAKPNSNTTRQWSYHGTSGKVVLCCSALTNEEKEIVCKFEKLSGVTEVKKWDSSVSHVIASTDENGACRRTLKFLKGIIEGKWILSIEWIKACMKANELVDEQLYEIGVDIHGVKNGPQRGRLRVLYQQPKLFDGCTFFFCGDFVPSYKGYLQDLVTAAGGKVLQRKPLPKDQEVAPSGNSRPSTFIIYSLELPEKCDPNKRSVIIDRRMLDAEAVASLSGAIAVSNSWVLNSIAACAMQKLEEE